LPKGLTQYDVVVGSEVAMPAFGSRRWPPHVVLGAEETLMVTGKNLGTIGPDVCKPGQNGAGLAKRTILSERD